MQLTEYEHEPVDSPVVRKGRPMNTPRRTCRGLWEIVSQMQGMTWQMGPRLVLRLGFPGGKRSIRDTKNEV